MASSTQSICSSTSFPSQRTGQDSTPASSISEERRKACLAAKSFIEREKAAKDNKAMTTETAIALADRSLVALNELAQFQSDISYIVVGAFSVFPFVPLSAYPSTESASQTTSASSSSSSSSATHYLSEDEEDIELSDTETESQTTSASASSSSSSTTLSEDEEDIGLSDTETEQNPL